MASFRVDVNPDVLKWARTTAHLSHEEAAKRLGVGVINVMLWEEGAEDDPTFAQLKDMARVYRRPLAVLLLPEPPLDFLVPKDFRTLLAESRRAWSSDLAFELRRVQVQREVVIGMVQMAGREAPSVTFPLDVEDDAETAGTRIRDWLGVTGADQAANRDRSLRFWTGRIEEKGILVAQIEGVAVEEMRGVSFSERPFPIVALNGRDSRTARVFTLLHEVAHVLLHDGGVCDLDHTPVPHGSGTASVERFCNRVAAATLMPRDDIRSDATLGVLQPRAEWPDAVLDPIARRFGVSNEAMLLRLVTLGLATADHYRVRRLQFLRMYAALRDQQKHSDERPMIKLPRRRLNTLGRRYVVETLDAYDREAITGVDLADYLDMNLKHLPRLVDLVREHA